MVCLLRLLSSKLLLGIWNLANNLAESSCMKYFSSSGLDKTGVCVAFYLAHFIMHNRICCTHCPDMSSNIFSFAEVSTEKNTWWLQTSRQRLYLLQSSVICFGCQLWVKLHKKRTKCSVTPVWGEGVCKLWLCIQWDKVWWTPHPKTPSKSLWQIGYL